MTTNDATTREADRAVATAAEPDADRTYSLSEMMQEYQRGFWDSDAINAQAQPDGDWLDKALDSVGDDVGIINLEVGNRSPWIATIGDYMAGPRFDGEGSTRRAAIEAAVEAKAKEHMR